MALTREGMKEERAGNTVGKREREERGEKKESNSINLCMDRWIFFKYFSFPRGNVNSPLGTHALKCVF